jgi:prevent-host-death family protein
MDIGQVSSDVARRRWRDLLDEAQRGETAEITRNGKPVAVLVSVAWYRWVIEYLRVLEEEDRAARDGRVVNHADGDPLNNDPRNLEIRDAPRGES